MQGFLLPPLCGDCMVTGKRRLDTGSGAHPEVLIHLARVLTYLETDIPGNKLEAGSGWEGAYLSLKVWGFVQGASADACGDGEETGLCPKPRCEGSPVSQSAP